MSRLSHTSRNTKSTTRFATGDRMPVRRRVSPSSVSCPECGAESPSSCIGQSGSKTGPHRARVRMATRAANEALGSDWDLVRALRAITHRERRALLRKSGLTTKGVALRLGVRWTACAKWFVDCDPRPDYAPAFARWLLEVRTSPDDARREGIPRVPPEVNIKPQGHRSDRWSSPPPRRPEREPARLDVGSACEDCGKWLPGERSVCGSCYVKRDRARRA